MGISFEEFLGGLGRWLDRVGSDIAWRWRMRSGGGGIREWVENAFGWVRERWTRVSWWLAVRGVSSDRLGVSGAEAARKSWKWACAACFVAICLMFMVHSMRPAEPEGYTEAEVAALQTLRVPKTRTGPPNAGVDHVVVTKQESALKAWLLSALGLR